MEIIIAISSILAITVIAWLLDKVMPFPVCPICAGVAGTWFWILLGIYSGALDAEIWRPVAMIAMGGSVVGIAYLGEKRFLWAEESVFYFKAPVILFGFAFVWWAVRNIGAVSIALEAGILTFLFYLYFVVPVWKFRHGSDSKKVKALEERLKSCC